MKSDFYLNCISGWNGYEIPENKLHWFEFLNVLCIQLRDIDNTSLF